MRMNCFKPDNKRFCSLTILILVSALVAFLFLTMYLAHLHVMPDGRVVLHSHALPLDSKDESHSHSKTSLLFSILFGHNFLISLAVWAFWLLRLNSDKALSLLSSQIVAQIATPSVGLRAPPIASI